MDACKKDLLDESSLIISVDTCHLRGFIKGQILTTVGIVGNDGMYPIAFVVCEGQIKENWECFLQQFMLDIDPHGIKNWSFILDQQKVCQISTNCVIFL